MSLNYKDVEDWLEAWHQHQYNPKENEQVVCTALEERDEDGKWIWCGGDLSKERLMEFFISKNLWFTFVFFNKKILVFYPPLLSNDTIVKLLMSGYKIKYDNIPPSQQLLIIIEP